MTARPAEGLLKPADLADVFGVTSKRILEWNRTLGWPCIKVGRFYRWTPQQLEEIKAMQTVAAAAATPAPTFALAGQSPRSAARRRTA